MATIKLAEQGVNALPALIESSESDDAAIRYWAVVGITSLREKGKPATRALKKRLTDTSIDVQLAAAEAVCRLEYVEDALPCLVKILHHDDSEVKVRALGILEEYRETARPLVADEVRELVDDPDSVVGWSAKYILDESMEWRY